MMERQESMERSMDLGQSLNNERTVHAVEHSICNNCRCTQQNGAMIHKTLLHQHHRSRRCSTSWFLTVICIIFVLLSLPSQAECQSQTTKNGTQNQPEGAVSNPEVRPIEKAMAPLYTMTGGFLNLIQPQNKGFILAKADILDQVFDGNFQIIVRSMEDWQLWVKHYLGFVICAVLGVLFIVVMPIVGFCFCCCRCCGHCGAKGDMDEKKGDQCRRAVCGGLLAIFTFILLAGMVCGFVTNELLREQTTEKDDRAVLNTVSKELKSLDDFKANTVTDFKTTVVVAIDNTAGDVIGDIKNAADNAKDELARVTDSLDILDEALEITRTTEMINNTMTTIKDSTAQLVLDRNTLLYNLSEIRTSLQQSLTGCSAATCVSLKNQVDDLQPEADFTKVDSVDEELRAVQDILNNNLHALIKDGQQQFDDITQDVQNDIQTELDNAEKEVQNIKDTVSKKKKVPTATLR